jgi:hypothetical protein
MGTPWYDSDNPDRVARGLGARLGIWIVVALVFFAVIGGAAWGVKVALSDTKGRGDSVRIKNSAPNRIAAQERFEQLYAEIQRSDASLDVLAPAAKAGGQAERTQFTGAVTYCLSVVADYNAEARKYRSQDFRAIDLPAQIDTTNPAFDCKESAR